MLVPWLLREKGMRYLESRRVNQRWIEKAAVLLSCKVKRCAKMDHESLKLTIRHLYNPDGKAGQIRPDNSPCKRDYASDVCLPQGIYLSGEEGDALGNWTRERGRGETNYSNCPCRNRVQMQEPI
ncbi:hypothetical protein DUI87_17173 [Hirundo rustica rustica]|uniref:Uncharacterized protein n=1 Tax=Hirundo rustica rustica TaxID=333673 RepID=A0A3M0K3F3_HIRRU|nr:hypothetical protein DUI87_17173 [Hirundo rustica rustica]